MNRAAIISALEAYRIVRGSGVSEPLRAVDVVGIADVILDLEARSATPVSYQRLGASGWVDVAIDDIDHYQRRGQAIRPLYDHPSPPPAADAEALLPEVMTEEMERVWRGAFIHQGHKRHGRGAIGNSRRLKNPESCEQYAWRALRKHLLAALKSTAAKEGG